MGSQPYGHYRVMFGEAVVGSNGVQSGTTSQQTVPAGVVRVECFDGATESPEVHEITLEVGDEKEVVFGEGG